jgi:hypothetical protein
VRGALKQLEIKGSNTTAYRPQVNGGTERLNQTIAGVMKKMSRDENHSADWDTYIDSALLAIRTTVNSSTGFTPSYLLYGYEMRTPTTWTPATYDYVEGELEEAILARCKKLQEEHKQIIIKARRTSDERKAKDKIRYDMKVLKPKRFEVGDLVLMRDMQAKGKFSDTWAGAFKVIRVNNNGTYHLTGKNSRKIKGAVNGDRLKDFQERQNMLPLVMGTEKEAYQRWATAQKGVYATRLLPELKTSGAAHVVDGDFPGRQISLEYKPPKRI